MCVCAVCEGLEGVVVELALTLDKASGIDDESIAAIARVLEVNSTISELDLAVCTVFPVYWRAVLTIKQENQFGLEGLKALARTLRRNHTLTKLNLNVRR